jgi:DNA topoisomerase I
MGTVRTAELQSFYLRRESLPEGGFRYLHPDGRAYRNRAGLARIASLAVPPAYTEVYVSPDPEATLQAFGRDAAGRLQYRYHPDFVRERAMGKWRRLARFAGALPQLRRRVTADLRRSGLPREKVLALLARLLDRVHLRVGYAAYARRYRSYGLTTLRKRHVQVEGNRVTFRYRGKHGVEQEQMVRDRTIAIAILRLFELPGTALFQYLDDEGGRHVVRAEELNVYIRESMGRFTAKDFRSWGGTLKAAVFLAAEGPPDNERSAGRILAACVRHVAAELGNTAAVTRTSYICPVIFDLYLAGTVVDDFGSTRDAESGLSRSEAALRRMLARALSPKRHAPSGHAPSSALPSPTPVAGPTPPRRGSSKEVQHDCR